LIDRNNIFNFILANDFLEHLKSERVCEILELVFNSLEKEGIFKLKVPNMSNPFSLISMYRDFTHNCGFTETSIYQVLYNVGFKDIQILSPSII
jgi:predicted SAM-dependent methyltransferase